MSSFETLKKVRRNCKKCSGSGFVPVIKPEGLYFDDCECAKYINEKLTWHQAEIPEQYWDFGIEDISEEFLSKNEKGMKIVNSYIANLDKMIDIGAGLWFCSPPGLGKSTIITSILKEAIKRNRKAYFMRTSHMVSKKFASLRDREARGVVEYITDSVEILALEEIEKVYLLNDESMANQLFYEFLSDMYDDRKALLVSSNLPYKEVAMKFPTFIQDRLRTLKIVTFRGESGRKLMKAHH